MTRHQGACSRGVSGGGFPPRNGCCVQAGDKICEPAPEGLLEGGYPREVCPPGTAAVSKHETGTVTMQITGALQFMIAFALQGGGWGQLLREYISLHCALGSGRSVRAKSSTPLANTSEHNTSLLCQVRDNSAVSKHEKGYCVKARDSLLSQSTRHKLGQTSRHTAVIKARDACCVKARHTLLYQTTRHTKTTVSKHDAGTVTHTAAAKHCCSVTAQHTKP